MSDIAQIVSAYSIVATATRSDVDSAETPGLD
jgi:hypothetical protein